MKSSVKKIPIGLAKVRKELPPPGKTLQSKKDLLHKHAKAELRRELEASLDSGQS